MITADFHVHSDFSSDSDTPMEEQIQKAIELGLERICFTDHMDYDFPKQYPLPFVFDMDLYIKELDRLQKKYTGQIAVLTGVELGLQPHIADTCHALTMDYRDKLDFVIGSTHIVDHLDPYYEHYWEDKSLEEGISRYFEVTHSCIRQDMDFDVYGHLDYIIRYIPETRRPKEDINCMKQFGDYIDAILKALIARGKGIECNTAGLKYGLSFPHPHGDILKRYRELGGEILTIGSDGHAPCHLAYGFRETGEFLKKNGFAYYTVFRGRKPEFIPVN